MRMSRLAISACIMLVLISCDEPTEPDPVDNRVILEPVNAELTGVVGGLTESPPEVRAKRASDGNPVGGVSVQFVPLGSQSGAVSATFAITDASGIASAGAWQLGIRAGIQTLQVYVPQSAISTKLTARARAGAPTSFTFGTLQTQYQLGARQPVAPSVVVRDVYGNGIEGMDATFSPGHSGGAVAVFATKTNANGAASAGTWTLPPTPGAYSVTAIIDARIFEFKAQKVDSSALAWYSLDSMAQAGVTRLPAAWNLKSIRLGVSRFDPCLCVNLAGAIFEIADYLNGQHHEYFGFFIILAGRAFAWSFDEVKVTATGVIVLRNDYYTNPITYFYTRKN